MLRFLLNEQSRKLFLVHNDIIEPPSPCEMKFLIQSHIILLKCDIALIKKLSNYQD